MRSQRRPNCRSLALLTAPEAADLVDDSRVQYRLRRPAGLTSGMYPTQYTLTRSRLAADLSRPLLCCTAQLRRSARRLRLPGAALSARIRREEPVRIPAYESNVALRTAGRPPPPLKAPRPGPPPPPLSPHLCSPPLTESAAGGSGGAVEAHHTTSSDHSGSGCVSLSCDSLSCVSLSCERTQGASPSTEAQLG